MTAVLSYHPETMSPEYQQHLKVGMQAGARYALAIPREAMLGATGTRLSNLAGASLDFKDFREYEPGDDLRRIDWNAYARSDKLIVKLYREEVAPHLDILLDGSRSMQLPGMPKDAAILRLAALLATAATNAQCSHRAWLSTSAAITTLINGNRHPHTWDGITFISAQSPGDSIHMPPSPRWHRHGIRVLISDLLWETDPITFLRPFAENAASVHVIQLLARAEENPALHGNCRLIDIESDDSREIFIDELARSRYREALSDLRRQWHLACRRTGATFSIVTAENIIQPSPDITALQKNHLLEVV